MDFDLGTTDALLATTRAVRKRLDLERPVSQDTVLQCLELAVQAPTGGNGQGWRWLVVDDAPTREAVANIYREAARGYLDRAWERARESGNAQTTRVYDSAMYLVDVLHRVPVHVIPCIKGRPQPEAPPAQLAGFYGSIFPAIWSFQLALRARGLGSALTTIHLMREREMAQLLGIPDKVSQIALLPVAWTVGTDFKRAARAPVSGITHWNRWQAG